MTCGIQVKLVEAFLAFKNKTSCYVNVEINLNYCLVVGLRLTGLWGTLKAISEESIWVNSRIWVAYEYAASCKTHAANHSLVLQNPERGPNNWHRNICHEFISYILKVLEGFNSTYLRYQNQKNFRRHIRTLTYRFGKNNQTKTYLDLPFVCKKNVPQFTTKNLNL